MKGFLQGFGGDYLSFEFKLKLNSWNKTFSSTETQTDRLENFYESISVEDGNLETSSRDEDVRSENRGDSVNENSSWNLSSALVGGGEKNQIDDLKMNLKVKENIIDSINDTLVLKEAEIARLKARISLMERKNILKELNDDEI